MWEEQLVDPPIDYITKKKERKQWTKNIEKISGKL